jgi:hypothetical protein
MVVGERKLNKITRLLKGKKKERKSERQRVIKRYT